MPAVKLMSLQDAVHRFVPDGAEAAMGLALETMIPFAAGREIIRQGKKNLTLVGPISDILFDQLIGAGCVRKVRAAWVGNVITGSGYNFRRAVENGEIEVEDHSNLTMAMALKAGAMGVPFMPCRTALGSDLFNANAGLKVMACPFTGETVAAVAAIAPDVAVVHAQRADKYGNAHFWGNAGLMREACLAARHVIITVEEIVETDVIVRDPNRVLTPGFKVSAVVCAPWGAHPSPVPGYYNRDHQVFLDYRTRSRTKEEFEKWKMVWADMAGKTHHYAAFIGEERLERLAITRHSESWPVDYGY